MATAFVHAMVVLEGRFQMIERFDAFMQTVHQSWVDGLAKRGIIQHDVARAVILLHILCLLMFFVIAILVPGKGKQESISDNSFLFIVAGAGLLAFVRFRHLGRLKEQWISSVRRGGGSSVPPPRWWTFSPGVRTFIFAMGTFNIATAGPIVVFFLYLDRPGAAFVFGLSFLADTSYVSSAWLELCQPRMPIHREKTERSSSAVGNTA